MDKGPAQKPGAQIIKFPDPNDVIRLSDRAKTDADAARRAEANKSALASGDFTTVPEPSSTTEKTALTQEGMARAEQFFQMLPGALRYAIDSKRMTLAELHDHLFEIGMRAARGAVRKSFVDMSALDLERTVFTLPSLTDGPDIPPMVYLNPILFDMAVTLLCEGDSERMKLEYKRRLDDAYALIPPLQNDDL